MAQMTFPWPLLRIGLIGGGQLGKMAVLSAREMGFYVTVLDPDTGCPAALVANQHIIGSLYDANKIRALACLSDVLTYEVEHIDVQTLQQLRDEGHTIYPDPDLLAIIQDKLLQKQTLAQHGVPVPRFEQVDTLDADYLASATFPLVQKARTGGYDGKGVAVLKSLADVDKLLPVPSMVEEYIDFSKELAIMIARSPDGKSVCYPIVEMVFDERTNICEIVAAPARIDSATAEKARQVALQAIEALNGVGVFGVEMFLTEDGRILLNEIAPRPHNSGHYTIEACITSQFDQLIRVVSGLPLGSSELLKPAVMLNLLGEAGHTGKPVIEGLCTALAIKGLFFHLYDKSETRPFRKMGHVTILGDSLESALEKLQQVKHQIKIKSR